MSIDWTAAPCPISPHFTVRDALRLPSWGGRLALPEDGLTSEVTDSLLRLFTGPIEEIRGLWGKPFNVHCAYRPPAYNLAVGGAPNSAHMHGLAVDFDAGVRQDNENLQQWILGTKQLDRLGLRMEDHGHLPGWLHLDLYPVGASGNRFFVP